MERGLEAYFSPRKIIDKKGKIKIKGESRKVSLASRGGYSIRNAELKPSWTAVSSHPRFYPTHPIGGHPSFLLSLPSIRVYRGRNRIPRSRARDRTRVARPALRRIRRTRIRPQVFQELRHYISIQEGRRKGKGDSSGGRGK